jgi:mono/diheme cytochrome c family protein
LKNVLGIVVAAIVLIVGGLLGFLLVARPVRATPAGIKIAATPARLARGRYLVEAVADCSGCHSRRDFNKYTGPVVQGFFFSGQSFPPELGFPGTVNAANITPDAETGIGTWTDGEKLRAIREGVSKDGHALFGFMPYASYAHMSDADALSVVAYLNSVAPVKNVMERTKLDFPVSLLNRLGPKPLAAPVPGPNRADKVAYGGYLAGIAGCIECHSQFDKGEPVVGMEFAGGHEFQIGKFVVNSANITPDAETGIGNWSEERFLARFKANAEFNPETAPPSSQAGFTLMGWPAFAKMQDDDIKAIYAYLRTIKPVHNGVDVHPALQ